MNDELASIDPSIRHGYAQVGDVRLHYAEAGSGTRLVMLLHGFPECWYSWRHQLKALSEQYHVVAPDLRGYNLSDKPPHVKDYRIARLVDDVLGLIRHFGARDAAIIGHDWGAAVAWALALEHPENVWKLGALQVPPPAAWLANISFGQLLRSWYMFFFQLPCLPEWWLSRNNYAALERTFKETARPGTFTDTDIAVYKAALDKKNETGEMSALSGGINYYRANFASLFLRRRDGGPAASETRVRVPTLFIYGERDFAIIPRTVRGVRDYVDAPYREMRLPLCNHWVQQEAPAEVNAALNSFLDQSF